MNEEQIIIGMVGAGRATELHMMALKKVGVSIPIRFKTIMARREEQLVPAKTLYGFEKLTYDFNELLDDEEIDVIDICTPPNVHKDMIIQAINAGKHVICEKPFTGYFGEGDELVGKNISKSQMYESVIKELDDLKKHITRAKTKFMYAENFVYAPSILKAAEVIASKKSKILYIKGEESLKGSSSPVAGSWNKTGGGTLIRTGIHPLSAALWLKQKEGEAHGVDIRVESVIADVETITPTLSKYEHRHIAAKPIDVEDISTIIIKFSDKSRAVISACDVCLGGSKNEVELYCNDTNIKCKLTMNNAMSTYFLDEDNLEDVELSEMLPTKLGWNNPFIADEFIRGYVNEMQDFIECICYDKEPKSGLNLAYDTIKTIYAAYKSAETNQRVYL